MALSNNSETFHRVAAVRRDVFMLHPLEGDAFGFVTESHRVANTGVGNHASPSIAPPSAIWPR
jgi:hypothetical protein